MPISILMPALSPTMEEGKLAKWLVKEGDAVAPGDVIAEIETDKATMEVEAIDQGTVGRILVAEGADNVPVNQLIALLLEDGEDQAALEGAAQAAAPPTAAQASPAPAAAPQASPPPAATPAAPAAAPPPSAARAPAPKSNGARVFASPLARRMAAESNLDLARLTGSGPHGRIIKRDIETALKTGLPAAAAAAAPAADMKGVYALYAPDSYVAEPVDKIRGVIAERLTASKRDIPHYYLTIDCVLDELLAARKRINGTLDEGKISVNDFVIKACALALMKVPGVNASWAGGEILRHKHADISMAVAIEGGLITPIIKQAEAKGLADIAAEARDLAGRARDRKLAPEEYQGGSFSVSNLGMFGVKHFTAVINPPQAAILAVGGGEKRCVPQADGSIAARTVMTVTMSCDHRVVDGALGARFLAAFKGLIEDPVTMLV
jgi:pyruvate dehydrogenase E2 component (dihydrolipoamide acetyltransferase)